jgi:FMN reductase
MATQGETVVAISGSASATSRSAMLIPHIEPAIRAAGFPVETILVRDLPADDLLHGRLDSPGLKPALMKIEQARGVIITTPIYKAAYSGVLKVFLDVLPQFGLTGKTVLPLVTGGSPAHVLAIDYALRPVLMSMNPLHIVMGLFILDKQIQANPGAGITLEGDIQRRLDDVLAGFLHSLSSLPPREVPAIPAPATAAS